MQNTLKPKLKRSFSHDYHATSIYLVTDKNTDYWAKFDKKSRKKPNNRIYMGFFDEKSY